MTDVVFLSEITIEHLKQLLAKSIGGGRVEAVDHHELPRAVWPKLNLIGAQTLLAFTSTCVSVTDERRNAVKPSRQKAGGSSSSGLRRPARMSHRRARWQLSRVSEPAFVSSQACVFQVCGKVVQPQ